MIEFSGRDVALLRLTHRGSGGRRLSQAAVGRAMYPPVSGQRVLQLERRDRLTLAQFHRLAAGILAASK